MSLNRLGHLLVMTTWGESHGPAIGCVVDGCPPGLELDEQWIQQWLQKRRPGTSAQVSARQESDRVQILSGVFEGRTTGTPIGLMIANEDARPQDYEGLPPRLGHADQVYEKKYGIRDPRGGGRASARETAARVAAGALARQESRGGHWRTDYAQTDKTGTRTFMTLADADRIAAAVEIPRRASQ